MTATKTGPRFAHGCEDGTGTTISPPGAHWPGSDLALLAVILAVLAFALGAVGLLRRADRANPQALGAGPLQVSTQ